MSQMVWLFPNAHTHKTQFPDQGGPIDRSFKEGIGFRLRLILNLNTVRIQVVDPEFGRGLQKR